MSPARFLGRRQKLLELYRRMVLMRAFESAAGRGAGGDDPVSEIVVAGAGAALDVDDYVVSPDRPQRFALARGIGPEAVMSGLLADARSRGSWRIVGGGLRAATDLAPALVRGGAGRALLCVPGSRAPRPAAVHRALDVAGSRRLPVVFLVCVADGAMSRTAERVDGDDVAGVHDAAARLLERARHHGRPAVLEVAVESAGTSSVTSDALSVTAVQLSELGTASAELLEIADAAEQLVAAALDRVASETASALIHAASVV